jgi:transcriptional regulator with XRE-family HTH domain
MTMPKAPTRLNLADPVHSFAREMRGLRFRAGDPSLKELARAMSCSHSTVSAYLNGRRLPSPRQLESFVLACRGNTADWMQRLEAVRDQLDRLPIAPGSSRSPAERRDDDAAKSTGIPTDRLLGAADPEAKQIGELTQTQDWRAAQPDAPATTAKSGEARPQFEQPNRKPARINRRARSSTEANSAAPSAAGELHIVLMDHAGLSAEGERITIPLIPLAASSLQALQDRTNLSHTDLANRAITS